MASKGKNQLKVVLLCASAWFGATGAGLSDVIYQQTFGNDSGKWKSPAEQGLDWASFRTVDGYEVYCRGMGISPEASLSSTSVNIGAAKPTETASKANGFFCVFRGGASLYTTTLNLTPSNYSSLQFNWLQNNFFWGGNGDYATVRVLIRQGGVWYVSAQSAPFHSDMEAHPESFTYNPAAANWLVLSRNEKPENREYASLSSKPDSDLRGPITAVGVTTWSPSGYWVGIDDFSVSVSPSTAPSEKAK